jgi:multidrug resistance efflux pump
MTTFKIKSFADLEACIDQVAEEKLQEAARLLSRHGATDEEIEAELAHQRAEIAEAKAQAIRQAKGFVQRGGESLQ